MQGWEVIPCRVPHPGLFRGFKYLVFHSFSFFSIAIYSRTVKSYKTFTIDQLEQLLLLLLVVVLFTSLI